MTQTDNPRSTRKVVLIVAANVIAIGAIAAVVVHQKSGEPPPDPQKAAPEEIADYLARGSSGFGKQGPAQQETLLLAMADKLSGRDARVRFLRHLNAMTDEQVERMRDGVFKYARDALLGAAHRYGRLNDEDAKREMILHKVDFMDKLRGVFSTYELDPESAALAKSFEFRLALPDDPDSAGLLMTAYTDAENRREIDDYLSAIEQEVYKRVKRKERQERASSRPSASRAAGD